MSERIDLADPDFEPTDEQLAGLMKRAFADARVAQAAANAKLREDIAKARQEAMAAQDAKLAARRTAK